MRVTLNDGRAMTGQMLAFDKVWVLPQDSQTMLTNLQHMNLVLADTEEFRKIKRRQNKPSAPGAGGGNETVETEEKRTLGLTIVRGAHIISLSVESPPPADPSARLNKTTQGGISSALGAGPGVAKPAGRGAPPPSLAVSSLCSSRITILTFSRDLRPALAVALLGLLPASLGVLPLASLAPVVVVHLPLVSVVVASLLVVLEVSLVAPLLGSAVLPVVLLLASSLLLDDKHVMAHLDWFCVSSIR